MSYYLKLIFLLLLSEQLFGQATANAESKINFEGDFRFRIEQDWNSLKPDGTYRDDRTRLRYRARFGVTYNHKNWVSFGSRIRTGDPTKQQDPHLTLGEGFKEFSTLPISFEKVYARFNHKWFSSWIGKNTFPFQKQNELFWSDNVFPEGIAVSGLFNFQTSGIQSLKVNSGHFIASANGASFNSDSYFQGIQFVTTHINKRLELFPSLYYFNKIPNIPDGNETFLMNYTIFHFGTKFELIQNPRVTIGLDYLQNLEDYTDNTAIPSDLNNQKEGLITSVNIGRLKNKGDWNIRVSHTYLERYAAVDYFAQNDWVRWDYSSFGSKDGRLTNFKGFEIMGGYAIDSNMNLKMRCFFVEQIIPYGMFNETGNRIRLDFNIKF